MQAIITKIIPATNTKPTRIKAFCARGSITIGYPHEFSGDAVHHHAATRLCAKFYEEDKKQNGTPLNKNPWGRHRVIGQLPNGDYAHVFID